ncbi:MAG: hypothetical protein QM687_17305 [Ferruginibacter sp.]
MLQNDTSNKIQDIISGKSIAWQTNHCTAARNYLCRSFSPSTKVKEDFEGNLLIKEKQAKALEDYISENNLWVKRPAVATQLLTIGGEAQVYIDVAEKQVIKLNDAIYYATWLDFFTSILLHNLFFPETSYTLIGFTTRGQNLQAVLTQPYIISDDAVNLENVKASLEELGFINTKRNDYYNKSLGLILEDIHDENVIMNCGFIFFIDTVFYVDL